MCLENFVKIPSHNNLQIHDLFPFFQYDFNNSKYINILSVIISRCYIIFAMIQYYNYYSSLNGLNVLWSNLECLQCQPSGRIWVCHSYIHTGHCIITPWGGPCLEFVGHIQMGVSKPLPASCQAGGGCCKIHIVNVLYYTRMSC